jgi:hypothetical protein
MVKNEARSLAFTTPGGERRESPPGFLTGQVDELKGQIGDVPFEFQLLLRGVLRVLRSSVLGDIHERRQHQNSAARPQQAEGELEVDSRTILAAAGQLATLSRGCRHQPSGGGPLTARGRWPRRLGQQQLDAAPDDLLECIAEPLLERWLTHTIVPPGSMTMTAIGDAMSAGPTSADPSTGDPATAVSEVGSFFTPTSLTISDE